MGTTVRYLVLVSVVLTFVCSCTCSEEERNRSLSEPPPVRQPTPELLRRRSLGSELKAEKIAGLVRKASLDSSSDGGIDSLEDDPTSCEWTGIRIPVMEESQTPKAVVNDLEQKLRSDYIDGDPEGLRAAAGLGLKSEAQLEWEYYKEAINKVVEMKDNPSLLVVVQRDLQRYNKFRRVVVDFLLEYVKQMVCDECVSAAMGSTKCTSDYDITVDGVNAGRVVIAFNKLFARIFPKKSSATVFDTNIYGVGWFDGRGSTCYTEKVVGTTNDGREKKMFFLDIKNYRPEIIDQDARVVQHKFAFMKVFQYLSDIDDLFRSCFNWIPDAWESFKRDLTRDGSPLLQRVLGQAETLHRSYMVEQNAVQAGSHTELFGERLMIRRNEMYGESCARAQELKVNAGVFPEEGGEAVVYNALGGHVYDYDDRDSACWMLMYSISEACVFGAETYWTEGAFLHVVGTLQAKMTIDVTIHQLIDSALENFADYVKEVTHVLHANSEKACAESEEADTGMLRKAEMVTKSLWSSGVVIDTFDEGDSEKLKSDTTRAIDQFVIDSSKYLFRLYDAAVKANEMLLTKIDNKKRHSSGAEKEEWERIPLRFGQRSEHGDDQFADCMRGLFQAVQKSLRGNSNLSEDAMRLPAELMDECYRAPETSGFKKKAKTLSLSRLVASVQAHVLKPLLDTHIGVLCLEDPDVCNPTFETWSRK